MSGERFTDLVGQLRAFGDDAIVFCDMPPLLVNDDAIIISEKLDGILIVVEQNVTTKAQLEAALRLVDRSKITGTIVNRFTGSLVDDYGYSGSYDYY